MDQANAALSWIQSVFCIFMQGVLLFCDSMHRLDSERYKTGDEINKVNTSERKKTRQIAGHCARKTS